MDLIEALKTPPVDTRVQKSKLDVWSDTLTDTEREALLKAATNPAWMHTSLRNTIAAAGGPKVSANTVSEWRAKHGWKRES